MKKAIKKQWLALILGTVGLVMMTGYLQKTQLNPTSADATLTLQGKAIEGTTFTAMNQQGDPITLTIRQVELDPADPDREIYLYTVFYRHSTASQSQNAQWRNLCQPDRSGIAKAIPLSGEWDKTGAHLDNDQITFACTNSVLAKCVRLGYKPWKTVNGQPLRNYHQACTRMIRADYCGNGISHTQEGTPIDVYDRLNVQQPTPDSGMVFEAAWSPSGAV